ncbi:prostate stem cell antigen isoform X1 [Salmo trutta]|uniref:prostate stem cell antigen isoform X1 n=1 Tax=Salmo trutta TaxID=8032 RepID=UPI001131D589|nr:ly6/PLAUR domain-containing protein 2 isoform X1 [Salmo trutta]
MGRSFFRVSQCSNVSEVLPPRSHENHHCSPPPELLLPFLSSTTTNDACNLSSQTCQTPLDTCMTTVDTFDKIKAIGKYCASARTCKGAASGASVDANGNGNQVTCCSSNLCNINGATGVGLSTLLTLAVCCSHTVLSILWLL